MAFFEKQTICHKRRQTKSAFTFNLVYIQRFKMAASCVRLCLRVIVFFRLMHADESHERQLCLISINDRGVQEGHTHTHTQSRERVQGDGNGEKLEEMM